nr:MAG TPA: hypothetical protein [Caudoviricetes sp.]
MRIVDKRWAMIFEIKNHPESFLRMKIKYSN